MQTLRRESSFWCSSMKFRPCIIVPVFNHASGACLLARRIEPYCINSFFINDGSDSNTTDTLRQLASHYDWIEIFEHEKNCGKGGAVISGLNIALAKGFSHALQIDADNQHNTDDIPRFLSLAQQNPGAVIIGRPLFDSSMPIGRRIGRYLTHIWVWIETISFSIKDSMCGFRVYPISSVVSITSRVKVGQRMDFDSEILVRLFWTGIPLFSVPTAVTYPVDGQSHFRMFYDNFLITLMHVRLVFGMVWRSPNLLYRRVFS